MSSSLLHKSSKTPSLETFKKFLKIFLREEKDDLWVLVIYGMSVSICSLVIPIAVQTFVNTIGFGLLLQPILILTLIVFTVLVFSGAMRALQTWATESLQQRLFAKVAIALALRIPQVKYSQFSENRALSEVNYFLEIATLQKTANVLILDGSAVVLQIIFGILLLAFYHPFLLALNFIILFFILFFFVGLARRAIETSIEESRSKYAVASWLLEMAANPCSFRTRESREYAATKTDELATNYVVKRKTHFKVLFRQILAAISLQIGVSSLLLGVGGWLVVGGQLTLGQLVASELIVSSVVLSVGKFGKYLESYYDLAASLDKIGHLFELPLERSSSTRIANPPENGGAKTGPLFHMRNYRLQDSQGKELLSSLSFDVEAGEALAITGSTAFVRRAILRSLYGLNDAYSGVIEFKGVDLRYHSLEQLRSKIAYVGKSKLLSGSVLENLTFGNRSASIPEIQKVLRSLLLEEFFSDLPLGLHTPVYGGALELNSSLERKILIARAVLSQPQVLLLEEAFHEPEEDLSLRTFFENSQWGFSLVATARRQESLAFLGRMLDLDGKGK